MPKFILPLRDYDFSFLPPARKKRLSRSQLRLLEHFFKSPLDYETFVPVSIGRTLLSLIRLGYVSSGPVCFRITPAGLRAVGLSDKATK